MRKLFCSRLDNDKSESENEMTNGEKIKEIFPQAEIIPQHVTDIGLIGYDVCIDGETYFSKEWWNMEYQEPVTNLEAAEVLDKYKSESDKI